MEDEEDEDVSISIEISIGEMEEIDEAVVKENGGGGLKIVFNDAALPSTGDLQIPASPQPLEASVDPGMGVYEEKKEVIEEFLEPGAQPGAPGYSFMNDSTSNGPGAFEAIPAYPVIGGAQVTGGHLQVNESFDNRADSEELYGDPMATQTHVCVHDFALNKILKITCIYKMK